MIICLIYLARFGLSVSDDAVLTKRPWSIRDGDIVLFKNNQEKEIQLEKTYLEPSKRANNKASHNNNNQGGIRFYTAEEVKLGLFRVIRVIKFTKINHFYDPLSELFTTTSLYLSTHIYIKAAERKLIQDKLKAEKEEKERLDKETAALRALKRYEELTPEEKEIEDALAAERVAKKAEEEEARQEMIARSNLIRSKLAREKKNHPFI